MENKTIPGVSLKYFVYLGSHKSREVKLSHPVVIRFQIFGVLQHLHDTGQEDDKEDKVVKVPEVDDPVTETT